jgi:CTP synthase
VSVDSPIHIGVIGKYLQSGDYHITDSHLSVYHALLHAGASLERKVKVSWYNAHTFEDQDNLEKLCDLDGIIVPGGFGSAGVEGMINAISYVRNNAIPYLGLCYGMQLAVIEFARSMCGMYDAHTHEVDAHTTHPVVTILPAQQALLDKQAIGGSMRLGAYASFIKQGSKVHALYQAMSNYIQQGTEFIVIERHRHRYEINPTYVHSLQQQGLVFSGRHIREDGVQLMEFVELTNHPFFVATQAHPELKSRFEAPSPLFYGFLEASIAMHNIRMVDF